MRILTHLLSLERLGGIEVNTLEVTRALAARGHDVHVLYGLPVTGSEPDMRSDFETAGITLHGPFPFASSLAGAPRSVPSFRSAAALAARLNPDVMWLQRFEHILWGQTVARWSRTPLVCHLHHMPNYGRATPVLARGVSQFLAVSEFIRDRWVARGLDGDRVHVVHNAVPPEAYPAGAGRERQAARRALGVPADAPTALYYGRLTEAKGLHIALDAWQRLGPSHCDAHLLLAGDLEAGTDPGLAAMVTTLGRTGAATVLPSQRHVAPLLHAADVVLFPTLAQEAFGRVALEALVTGRPVIASDIGGVPEILAGPLAELLVPPGDADALATTLASLLRWREERPGLGTLCRTEAESRFSFDRHVDTVATALERAASGRRSHPRS